MIEETPWFDNLVTDAGLDYPSGTLGGGNRCVVGSGNTTPDYSDTTLESQLGSTGSSASVGTVYDTSSRWYFVAKTTRFSFSVGQIVGTIREVGIGNDDPVFSRSLIKDELGNPTEIALTSADQLYVLYEHRLYVDSEPQPIEFLANGITQTGVKNIAGFPSGIGLGWSIPNIPARFNLYAGAAYYGATALGSPSGFPTGASSSGGSSNVGNAGYVLGSHQKDGSMFFGGSGTATAFYLLYSAGTTTLWTRAGWQFFFSPGIPKTATQTFTVNTRISWGRYEP